MQKQAVRIGLSLLAVGFLIAKSSADDLSLAVEAALQRAEANRDHPLHAIYAVSYKRTPQVFPLIWDQSADYVFAVNVTDRYKRRVAEVPKGHVEVMFCVIDRDSGERRAVPLSVIDAADAIAFEGTTKDERFDANDHLGTSLPIGQEFRVRFGNGETVVVEKFKAEQRNRPLTFFVAIPPNENPEDPADAGASSTAVEALKKYLADGSDEREPFGDQGFINVPLTRGDAVQCAELLWQDHAANLRQSRAMEMKDRELADGDLKMPFFYKIFGKKPEAGRSMYISLHGGGGAPKQINDRQWENQKRLYTLDEGVYVVPRAPTNTWNLWHQGHIDRFFDRLIEDMILFEDVDPNRVYLMGYSAGGDGVYQLAPRMADRFAAAAMMAGHPNETSPLGLRNLAFTIHVGGCDSGYNRNAVAREWQKKLGELRESDPAGYVHLVKIYPDKGHWLDRQDAAAIPWMAKHRRDPHPKSVVWKQDDVFRARYYWLAVKRDDIQARAEMTAKIDGQKVELRTSDVRRATVRLNDQMLDLDKPITVVANDRQVFHGTVRRTIGVLRDTLAERGDPSAVFSSEIEVEEVLVD